MDVEKHSLLRENELLNNRCKNIERALATLKALVREYVDAVDNMYKDYDSWYIVHTRVKQALTLANTDSKEDTQ